MTVARQAVCKLNYASPARLELLDGDALRRDLTALAHFISDKTKLRKEALILIKTTFSATRGQVRERVESGAMTGVVASRALSDIQDVLLQVLYDFTSKHFYFAQNPTQAEHLAIVATGATDADNSHRIPTSICFSCAPTSRPHGARV